MKIEVTLDDIKNGMRGNRCSCMIARAIKRQVPNLSGLAVQPKLGDVGEVWYRVQGQDESKCLTLPIRANARAKKFDRGEKVKPFSFTLGL